MQGRPHAERLRPELDAIRTELAKEIQQLGSEEFDWAPRPDMKTFKQLLQEIGTMEKLCIRWLTHQEMLDWKEVEGALAGTNSTPTSVLQALELVRAETLQYLQSCSEEQLQTPVPLPEEWHRYWSPTIEPEEILRWVGRHEYYHLGQIISYRWTQGHNPYTQD
jgi:uncharacterized damage-inducible protein DinB